MTREEWNKMMIGKILALSPEMQAQVLAFIKKLIEEDQAKKNI